MEPIVISKQTARRFVLGKQGLWPGRRWAGVEGAAAAARACEAIQLDPLNMIARSHHLTLHSRVADYQPEYFSQLLYQKREFFDYGGALYFYPMDELPYWRLHMHRRGADGRWAEFIAQNSALIAQVKGELRARGPLGNRDFTQAQRVDSYRGRKDTALALFALWITGEVMIHHRRNFQRVYDFHENIVPPALNYSAPDEQAEQFFAHKALAFLSLALEREWKNVFSGYILRQVDPAEASAQLAQLTAEKIAAPVKVAGEKAIRYAPAADLEILETLESGGIPPAWRPLETTTVEEITILAPLDIVSARGRAAWLFGFDYVWEVYKPAAQRRWGYYTLPILYGDRLVARFDSKFNRKTKQLEILGFWLEERFQPDADFGRALAAGFQRFLTFLQAERLVYQTPVPQSVAHSLKPLT